MHNDIADAKKAISKAKYNLKRTRVKIRKTCQHEKVVEIPFSTGWLGANWPRRICVNCTHEEVACHFPGFVIIKGKTNYNKPTTLNSEFVKIISVDELYLYRA